MAERLTEYVIKNCSEPFYRFNENSHISVRYRYCANIDKAINKLGKLEDILEKYDLEVEELDGRIYNGAFNYIDKLKAETDRDTWKRACELACETLKQVMGKPLWIGGNIPAPEVKDSEYFYQQAKKERNDE